MRAHILIGSLMIAACAIGIGRAAEQKELPDFRIVVSFDRTKNEVELKCTAGCAWTELTFGCDEQKQCSSAIDAGGTTD
jgi:hypothetical protein